MLRLSTIFFAVLTLVCISNSALTAQINAVGLPGNQRLRISGPIEPGDYATLTGLANNSATFPAGVLIDSAGGDLAESIAIGRFVRDAMLPVTATEHCAGGCVLIWIAPLADETRDYLRRMELDDALIGRLADSPPLSPEQALALLGASSPGHESRLTERCGALDEQQYKDWRAIQSLEAVNSALNAMAQGMGGQAMYVVDPETERQAAAARDLSPDYRRELATQQAGIEKCRQDSVATWRSALPD